MRAFTVSLLACIVALPATARTLTMPTKADMQLLRSHLAASPPDYEAIASRSDLAAAATEFDRADVVAREADRLRAAYLEIGEVDRIVIRLDSGLSRYDGPAGGFRLRALEPDRYVAFGFEKLLFDNAQEFAVWKLSPVDGRKMLDEVGTDRNVQLEIEAIPVAASATDRLAVRAQIRTIRVTTRDGMTLDEMSSSHPEAERVVAGQTKRSSIPTERLELLGLRVGASYAEFLSWVAGKGFESDTIRDPLLKAWRYQLSFAAEPGVIPPPSDDIAPPRQDFWSPLPVVGENFGCDAKTPENRICGSVTFSPDPLVEDKSITSIRLAQTIGATSESVAATLAERFGSPSDSFAVEIPTWNGSLEARQLVWGAPSPRNDDTVGSEALTDADQTWQIEAILVEMAAGRTVLIIQVGGSGTGSEGTPVEARL